jgi:hypothetical protein
MPATARPRPLRAFTIGLALGIAVELLAVVAAAASAGAGHGDYVAARVLFPAPMLLTLLEGDRIGPFSLAAGLLQFPIYGGLMLWSATQRNYLLSTAVALLHVLAVMACFSDTLPNFS